MKGRFNMASRVVHAKETHKMSKTMSMPNTVSRVSRKIFLRTFASRASGVGATGGIAIELLSQVVSKRDEQKNEIQRFGCLPASLRYSDLGDSVTGLRLKESGGRMDGCQPSQESTRLEQPLYAFWWLALRL